MADTRLVPFELYGTDGQLTVAEQIGISETGITATKVDDAIIELSTRIGTLAAASFNSGRAFTTFTDGFVIDNTNITTYEDRNNIYVSIADKNTDVFLPSDADIAAAAVSYPVAFEFTHLGGTKIIPGNNLLRIYIADGNTSLLADQLAALAMNQVTIITKSAAGQDWVASTSALDPMSTLLPSGVFDLQIGRSVDIPTIATDLASVTISAGHAFIVDTGGTRFGADIEARDVIVALTGSPSLAADSTDWLVLTSKSGRVLTTDEVLFFNQVTRDGIRFDLSSNVFVDPANVVIQSYSATGVPANSNFVLTPNTNTEQTLTLGNLPIQFATLVGGRLTLQYSINTTQQGGFEPEFRELVFDYGNGITFSFDILNQAIDTTITLSIDISNVDYSLALNTNPTVTLRYIERGFQWLGTIRILSMINTLKGTLHDSIISLITSETTRLQQDLNDDIARIDGSLDALHNSIADLSGELDHAVLDLPDAVVGILRNDIDVTQEAGISQEPTNYNIQLGGDGSTAGAIVEENTPTQTAGTTTTANISQANAARRGKKLFYPITDLTDGATLMQSNLGGVLVPLITREGDNLVAKQLVPAHGGGTRTVTHYPAPPNQIGGPGRYFLLNLKTTTNQPVDAEISFTNDIPTSTTTVTINSRILVNGNNVNDQTHTLSVGGADSSVTFVEDSGSELISVTVRYRSAFNDIEVQASPQNTQFAIADLEIRMQWTETVTEASFAATTADHIIAPYIQGNMLPIAIKPSITRVDDNAAVMIIVTENGEINTGYTFTTLFSNTDVGFIQITSEDTSVYDLNFNANQLILTDLNARINNLYFGLFTDNATHSTVVNLDTQITARDRDDNQINFGDDIILRDTVANAQYRITVESGVVVATLIT